MSAVELATAYVSLVPSLKGANAGIASALAPEAASAGISSGEKLGAGLLATVGKFAAPIAAALGIGAVLKTGFEEALDAAAGTAQLAAGIQSTGNAANVTVDGLNSLAGEIQNYSGQTDDSIVKSEQLLLTFTNIKNNGPDKIFDDATRATADMAAKMGGDASASAIQLGKALNDPVQGISALQRVGVSFTDAQKKTIQSLVDTGNVAGAQRIILNELNKEFGGAAKAAGESFPGQLQRAHRAFEDLSQGIVQGFLPVMQPGLEMVIHLMQDLNSVTGPAAQAVADGMTAAGNAVGAAFELVKTGNFTGAIREALHVEEDSGLVNVLMTVHDGFLIALHAVEDFHAGFTQGVDALGSSQSTFAHWGAVAYGAVLSVKHAVEDFYAGFTTGTYTNGISRLGSVFSATFAAIGSVLQGVPSTISSALKGIDFGSLFGPLLQAVQTLIPTIAPLIPQFLEVWQAFNPFSLLIHSLLPILPQLSGLIGALAGNLVSTLGGALTAIVPALADAALTISESLTGALSALLPAIGPILSTLIGAITQLVPLIGAVVGSFAPLVAQILPVVVGLFTSLLPPIVQLITTVLPQFIAMGTQLVQTVFGALGQILPVVATAVTGVVGGLATALFQLVPVIGQVLGAVMPLVSSLVTMLVPIIVQLVQTVLPPVVTIFTTIVTAIMPLVSTILGILIPVIQALLPIVGTVFGAVANIIGSVMQIVQGIIQVVTGIISGNWSMVWSGILNIFSGIWNTIVNVVSGVINIIGSVIGNGLNAALQLVGGILGAIAAWFANSWAGILGGIGGFIGSVMNYFSGLPGKIMGFFAGAGQWLVGIGQNIVQGLIDGISGMGHALVSALLNLLPGPIRDLAHSLGIASPSKLFRDQIGRWIPAGLVLGIEDGKADVSESVRNLVNVPAATVAAASRMAPAISGGSQSAAPAGVTINGNVYGNPEDIVKEMDARARRAGAVNGIRAIAMGAA